MTDNSRRNLRLLIYQPNHDGHHFAYLGRMLPGLVSLPIEPVLATTAQAVQSKEFAMSLAPFVEQGLRVEACCTLPPRSMWANARHRMRELIGAVRRLQPDHVHICYADAIWQLLAMRSLLGRWPFPADLPVEAWLFRGRFGYPEATEPAARAKRLLLRHLLGKGRFAALHMHDELLAEHARRAVRRLGGSRTRLILTPDPVELFAPTNKADARQRLGLRGDRRIICGTGLISHRKGMHLLAQAFHRYLEERGDRRDQLVLAGPHDDAIKAFLAESPYRTMVDDGFIHCFDRFLSAREMYDFSAAADLVAASYPAHSGRSSTMLWASAAGRPIIGTEWGCIGHVIRTEHLGLTCNVLDMDEFADYLHQGLHLAWSDKDAQRVRRYTEFHRVENYQHVATTLLRERLGIAEGTEA